MNHRRLMPAVLVALVLAAALTAASAWGAAGIYSGDRKLEPTCAQLDHAATVLLRTIVEVPEKCEAGSLDCIAELEMAAHAEKLLDVVLAIRRQECSEA